MTAQSKVSRRWWFFWAPLLLLILSSLPTLMLGYDTEAVIGFIHPFMFGKVSPNFFANLSAGTPMQFVNYTAFRPLYYLSFNLDYLLYGSNIFYYRLENVLWLVLTWILFWRLTGKLGMGGWARFANGVAFAVHPAHVFMMQAIFSRTDLVAAVFCLAVFNLWLAGTTKEKLSWQYWAVITLFALSFLWKELFLILPPILLLFDLCSQWTQGSLSRRLIRHLPFWAIAALAVGMQLATTGTLGYNQGDAEVSQAVLGILPQAMSFLNTLLGLDGWVIPWLGSALFAFLLLAGPSAKMRLSLVFTLLLLIPYIVVWSSYMHVFLASLGLALWVGFALEWLLQHKRIGWLIAGATLITFLGISWALLYINDLPVQLREGDRISRIAEYVHHAEPHPPAGAVLTLAQEEWLRGHDTNKVLLRTNRILQILYQRDDVYLVPLQMAYNKRLPSDTPRIPIILPASLLH
jgi:hypothetical protein